MPDHSIELTDLTITQALAMLREKQLSPVELAQAHLERIALLDPRLNAFISVTGELALEQAAYIQSELRRPTFPGMLLPGIPLALKDLFETRGVRTTAGSRFFAVAIPENDAVVVQKLAAAGMVLLGKLNMHEIALGVTNANPHFGACRNPWDTQRSPGGSSGGSGAALAAGLCLGSLGSDTGGSIRIPASLCGVVGLKPTYGRVSLRGVIPLSWTLDHAGPMARSVMDAALLLGVVAGYDPLDPACQDVPNDDYLAAIQAGVKGWKIALADGAYLTERTDPEVWQAFQSAARLFEALGAEVTPVELPELRQAALTNGLITQSDAAAFHHERLQENPDWFGEDVLQRLRAGVAFTSTEYSLARRAQAELRRSFQQLLSDYQVLLTPTTPIPAPPIEGPDAIEQARLLTRFTAPFNLTGLPALSLPCGFTSQGLPIGLQVIAGPWAEATVLRAAYAYEQAAGWRARRPTLAEA